MSILFYYIDTLLPCVDALDINEVIKTRLTRLPHMHPERCPVAYPELYLTVCPSLKGS